MRYAFRICSCLVLLAAVAARADAQAQKAITLTALDYVEIEQLVAKYSRALDTSAGFSRAFGTCIRTTSSHRRRQAPRASSTC
jgi:hypothetical protein